MSPIGICFAIAFLLALAFRPAWIAVLLGLAIPFQNTAMLIAGQNSVSIFWGGVCIVALRLGWLLLFPPPDRWFTRYATTTRWILGILVAYSTVITVVAPRAFEGIRVYVPRYGIDDQLLAQGTLAFGVSNIAQLIYLFLAAILIAYLFLEKDIPRWALAPGLILGIGLTLIRQFLGEAWPTELLENMPNIWYAIYEQRARGPFAEPSILASFIASAFAYFGALLFQARRRSVAFACCVALALILYAFSLTRAATGVAGMGAVVLLGAIMWLYSHGRRPVRVPLWATLAAVPAGIALIAASPTIYRLTMGLLLEKSGTESIVARTAADNHAWKVLANTWGLGAGLGSNRPSSLFTLLVSTIGIPGTAFFLALVAAALIGGYRTTHARPYVWALVAALFAGLSSKPDLNEPTMWMLLGLCLRYGAQSEVITAMPRRLGTKPPRQSANSSAH